MDSKYDILFNIKDVSLQNSMAPLKVNSKTGVLSEALTNDFSLDSSQLTFTLTDFKIPKKYTDTLLNKSLEAFVDQKERTYGKPAGQNQTQVRAQMINKYDAEKYTKASIINHNIMCDRINTQIKMLKDVPPLKLLVNPNTLKFSYEHTTEYNSTRLGIKPSVWIPKPIKISASGVSAGFYSFEKSEGQIKGGITHVSRISSVGYKSLLSLQMLYKSNGMIYNPKQDQSDSYGVALQVASVCMAYAGTKYFGSFDSLSLSESAEKPHLIEYTFDFTVRKMITG